VHPTAPGPARRIPFGSAAVLIAITNSNTLGVDCIQYIAELGYYVLAYRLRFRTFGYGFLLTVHAMSTVKTQVTVHYIMNLEWAAGRAEDACHDACMMSMMHLVKFRALCMQPRHVISFASPQVNVGIILVKSVVIVSLFGFLKLICGLAQSQRNSRVCETCWSGYRTVAV
jgi:hypothetical protein